MLFDKYVSLLDQKMHSTKFLLVVDNRASY